MNKLLLDELKIMYDGMTQVAISELSGLTQATISKIWNSKQGLTIDSFCKLCSALDNHHGVKSMMTSNTIWEYASSKNRSKTSD